MVHGQNDVLRQNAVFRHKTPWGCADKYPPLLPRLCVYFTSLLYQTTQSLQQGDIWNGSWSNSGFIPTFLQANWGKPQKVSDVTASVWDAIRTEYLSNTNPHHHPYTITVCSLRFRSAVARLLGSRVRIPLKTWMFVSCVCCVVK